MIISIIIAWILLGLLTEYLYYKYLMEKGWNITLAHFLSAILIAPMAFLVTILFMLDKIILIKKKESI